MDSSLGTGFMAVFAVSGSVVFLAMQAHKRLLSNFMKEMEFEFKNSTSLVTEKGGPKKKVRFAGEDESHRHKGGKSYVYRAVPAPDSKGRNVHGENLEAMPQNWQAMYRGILKYRNLKGYNITN